MAEKTSGDTIKVAVRVRPKIKREGDMHQNWVVKGNDIFLIEETGAGGSEFYTFDFIFDTCANNETLYEVVKPIVQTAVNGINSTVFAYGQTSSGKTHTIMGHDKDPGIIPRAIDDIFMYIANTCERKFLIRASYIEIYNEKLYDLLQKTNKDPKFREELKIRENVYGNVVVEATEKITSTKEDLLSLMAQGNKNRQIGETNMNERSSRSHVIFKLIIESSDNSDDDDAPVQVSNLYIVDLAGSERVAQTKATGARLKEGGHINKSLSTLSLVIRQLSENQEYVSFRDSKLTRLLSNALGGNSKTLIIATITPVSIEDSQSTLKFAKCAKTVKIKPQINEILTDAALIKRHQKMEKQLLLDLKTEKEKNITLQNDHNLKEMKIKELEEQLKNIYKDFVICTNKDVRPTKTPSRRKTTAFELLVPQTIPTLTVIKEESEVSSRENTSMIPRLSIKKEKPQRSSDSSDTNYRSPERSESVQSTSTSDSTPTEILKLRYEHLERSHIEWKEFYDAELKCEISTATERFTKELNDEREISKKLQVEKNEISKELQQQKKKMEQLDIVNGELEIQLDLIRKKFKSREAELLQSMEDCKIRESKQLETELNECKEKYDTLKEEYSVILEQRNQYMLEVEGLTSGEILGEMRKDICCLKTILVSRNSEDASEKASAIKEELTECDISYLKMLHDSIRKKEDVSKVEIKKYAEAVETFITVINNLTSDTTPPKIGKESEYSDKAEKNAELEKHLQEASAKLQLQAVEIEKVIQERDRLMENMESTKKEMDDAVRKLSEVREVMETKEVQHSNRNRELQYQLKILNDDYNDLQECMNREKLENKLEIDEERIKFDRAMEEQENIRNGLETDVKEVKFKLASREEELDKIRCEYNRVVKEMEKLENQRVELSNLQELLDKEKTNSAALVQQLTTCRTDQVAELQDKIATLSSEAEVYKRENAEVKQSLKEFEELEKLIAAENVMLSKQVVELQDKIATSLSEAEEYKREIVEVKQSLKEFEELEKLTAAENVMLSKQLAELQSKIATLSSKAEVYKRENVVVKQSLEELEELEKLKAEENVMLSKKLEELQSEFRAVKEKYESVNLELVDASSHHQSIVLDLEEKVNLLVNEIEEHKLQSNARMQEAQSDLDKLKVALQKLEVERSEKAQEIRESYVKLQTVTDDLAEVTADFEIAKLELEEMTSKAENANSRLVELEAKSSTMQTEKDAELEQLRTTIHDLKIQLEHAQGDKDLLKLELANTTLEKDKMVKNLKEELSAAILKMEKMEETHATIQIGRISDNEGLLNKLRDLEKLVDDLGGEKTKMEKEKSKFEDAANQLTEENNKLGEKCNIYQENMKELKWKLEEEKKVRMSEKERYSKQIEDLQEEKTIRISEMDSCSKHNEDLQGELKIAQGNYEKLSVQLADANKAHKDIMEKMQEYLLTNETEKSKMNEKYQLVIKELEQKTLELQKLNNLERDAKVEADKHLKEKHDLQNNLRKLERDFVEFRANLKLIVQEDSLSLAHLKHSLGVLIECTTDMQIFNDKSAEQSTKHNRQIRNISDDYMDGDLLRARIEIQNLEFTLQEKETNLKRCRDKIDEQNEALLDKECALKKLNTQVEKLQSELLKSAQSSGDVDKLTAEVTALKAELHMKTETIKDLQGKHAEAISKIERQLRERMDRVTELEDQNKQLTSLKAELHQKTETIKEIQGKNAEAISKIERQLRERMDRVTQLEEQNMKLTSKTNNLLQQLEETKTQLNLQITTAKAELHLVLQEESASLKKCKSKIDEQNELLLNKEIELKKLNLQVEELQNGVSTEVTKLTSEVASLKEEILVKSNAIAQHEETSAQLNAQLKELTDRMAMLEKENIELSSLRNTLQQKLNEEKSQLSQSTHKLNEALSRESELQVTSKISIGKLTYEMACLKAELGEKVKRIGEMQCKNAEQASQIELLNRTLWEQKKLNEDLELQVRKLQEEVKVVASQNTELKSARGEVNEQVNQLQSKLKELEASSVCSKCEALRENLRHADDKVLRLHESNKRFEKETSKIIEEQRCQIERLTRETKACEKCNSIQEKLQKANINVKCLEESKERLAYELSGAYKTIEEQRTANSLLKIEAEQQTAGANDTQACKLCATLQQKMQDAEKRVEELEADNKHLDFEAEYACAEVLDLNRQLGEFYNKVELQDTKLAIPLDTTAWTDDIKTCFKDDIAVADSLVDDLKKMLHAALVGAPNCDNCEKIFIAIKKMKSKLNKVKRDENISDADLFGEKCTDYVEAKTDYLDRVHNALLTNLEFVWIKSKEFARGTSCTKCKKNLNVSSKLFKISHELYCTFLYYNLKKLPIELRNLYRSVASDEAAFQEVQSQLSGELQRKYDCVKALCSLRYKKMQKYAEMLQMLGHQIKDVEDGMELNRIYLAIKEKQKPAAQCSAAPFSLFGSTGLNGNGTAAILRDASNAIDNDLKENTVVPKRGVSQRNRSSESVDLGRKFTGAVPKRMEAWYSPREEYIAGKKELKHKQRLSGESAQM